MPLHHAAPASPVALVRAFYAAVAAGDSDALSTLVSTRFAPEARLVLPQSLPYGGVISGSHRLARLFAGMAGSTVDVGPRRLSLEDVIDGGDRVGALLSFDWYAAGSAEFVATGALELWTFTAGKVSEIDAFYRDTARCRQLADSVRS